MVTTMIRQHKLRLSQPGRQATNRRLLASRLTCRRMGFSLLEVVLSAAILAASSMVLFSTFSLGDRQGTQAVADQQAMLLCQSLVDELLARPDKLLPAEGVAFPAAPEWAYWIQSTPTGVDGLVAVTVRVAKGTAVPVGTSAAAPAQPGGRTQVVPATPAIPTTVGSRTQSAGTPAPARSGPECTIVRWMRAGPADADSQASPAGGSGSDAATFNPPSSLGSQP